MEELRKLIQHLAVNVTIYVSTIGTWYVICVES